MLTAYNRPQFIEKVFTAPDGRQWRMVFLVALVDGKLKGRLVSAEQLAKNLKEEANFSFLLPAKCKESAIETEYRIYFTPVVSPYTTLLFFYSQPTRAPSFKTE